VTSSATADAQGQVPGMTVAHELGVRQLSSAVGVEVEGLDLADEQTDERIAEVRSLLVRHGVVLFRDQTMSHEQHLAFSSRFGPLDDTDYTGGGRLPGHPAISVVKSRKGVPRTGGSWHSDLSFTLRPALLSILYAQRVPSIGGDTMFANMHRAYDTLSPAMQKMLGGLHAVHTMRGQELSTTDAARRHELDRCPPVVHPLVRIHDETGRPYLYVGRKVVLIEGMTRAESMPLLTFLFEHASTPELVYRHRWQVRDVLMWDNRVVNHIALGDYDPSEDRELTRTAVVGDEDGWLFEGAALA
jgi:taurine dioxygenase